MESMGVRGPLGKWTTVGRELRKVDPRRFAELLELAERIVQLHKDPLRTGKPRVRLKQGTAKISNSQRDSS